MIQVEQLYYIFLLYCPPTSKSALVICPSEQYFEASIIELKIFLICKLQPFKTKIFLTPLWKHQNTVRSGKLPMHSLKWVGSTGGICNTVAQLVSLCYKLYFCGKKLRHTSFISSMNKCCKSLFRNRLLPT